MKSKKITPEIIRNNCSLPIFGDASYQHQLVFCHESHRSDVSYFWKCDLVVTVRAWKKIIKRKWKTKQSKISWVDFYMIYYNIYISLSWHIMQYIYIDLLWYIMHNICIDLSWYITHNIHIDLSWHITYNSNTLNSYNFDILYFY